MAKAEPVLPVGSAFRACGFSAQQSNRWEIEPPMAHAWSSTATCRQQTGAFNGF